MITKERQKRLEEAIKHLMAIGMIDGKSPSKSIAEKMDRGINGISSALNGNERYLTWKFVRDFCATFSNIISADWIWNGTGKMIKEETYIPETKLLPSNFDILQKEPDSFNSSIDKQIYKLSKDELINLVKELMSLHNEQTEMYRLLIRQNEQMIRLSHERFNNITNIIYKNV